MRRRLYFLAPNLKVTRAILDELQLARITEKHISVIAREGTKLEDVPEATLLQRSDLKPAAEHGIGYGGVVGLLAGLVAVAIPPAGLVLGGGMLAGVLGGAGFGACVGGMIGVNAPNRELEEFEEAVKRGEILMLIDVPRMRVEEIEELVRSKHPAVEFEGVEPHKPVFP